MCHVHHYSFRVWNWMGKLMSLSSYSTPRAAFLRLDLGGHWLAQGARRAKSLTLLMPVVLWTKCLCPYVEAPIPSVMISGGRAFGRYLGLNKAMKIETPWWHECLYKEMKGPECSLSTVWGYSKKTTIYEPGGGLSTRTPPCWHPASSTMRNKCFLSHPV